MRILIMGSGIGGVFGATLAKPGAYVTFVARGVHFEDPGFPHSTFLA